MPIHCVIEVSQDLGKQDHGGTTTVTLGCRSSPGGGGPDTINVIKDSSDGLSSGKVLDEFVIIPTGTPFQDVVTTVLNLLGYPKDIIRQAEGTISLRNWKPLRLDQVCDSPHKTVGDILNDLTNYATLRVLVTRAKGTTDDMKEKLLRLLLAQSSTLLLGAGCPLDEVTLKQLVKGQWPQNLAEDVKRRFDQWYAAQHHQTVTGLVESLQQHHSHLGLGSHQFPPQIHSSGPGPSSGTPSASSHGSTTNSNGSEMTMSPGIRRDGLGTHLLNGLGALSSSLTSSSSTSHLLTGPHHSSSSLDPHHHRHHDLGHHSHPTNKSPFTDDGIAEAIRHNHPVFHGLSAQKTRMRTSFDPEMELPKLQQWFADNPHPSRHQIQQYVRELNLLDCRKDRKALDVNNVIYWFKNARAAQKRNELRYNGITGHHQPFSTSHLSHQQHLQLHAHQYSQSSQLTIQSSNRSPSPQEDDMEDLIHNPNHDPDGHRSSRVDNEIENSSSSPCNSDQEGQDDFMTGTAKDGPESGREKTAPPTPVTIKEEFDEDFISVEDVSHSADEKNGDGVKISRIGSNDEPKDLSAKSPSDGDEDGDNNNKLTVDMIKADIEKGDGKGMEDEDQGHDHESSSTSLSPRSSPGLSPNHHFDFGPSMVGRFHPFFDHPSFMAYRQFNSFNFGQNFGDSASNMENSNNSIPVAATAAAAYEAALTRKNLGMAGGKFGGNGGASGGGGGPLDIFHEFPHGLHRQQHHDSLARLRGDEMFSPRSVSNADIISSFINCNRGELSLSSLALGGNSSGQNSLALDERRKRNRTFIDPVTEVPRLEQWFGLNTHPSHNLILKYTDELNRMPYRQKFPRLEPKNVQFWMKNRRAKVKRMKS